MARKNKTTQTSEDVIEFLKSFVDSEQKMTDSLQLIKLMHDASGFEPRMWGPSIIGFGNYHYKYPSGHEGDAPLLGFSPRKAAISLYVFSQQEGNKHLLDELGKFKISKSCIYIKKLADININALEKICKTTLAHHRENHECAC